MKVIDSFPVSVSVVVCTLDEEHNVGHVLRKMPPWIDELIVVDGWSQDRTVEVVRQFAPHARILHQSGTGKGDALRCGVAAATGDVVVTMDADGSHDPTEITNFVAAILQGNDLVKGSRFLPGGGTRDMPLHRVLANWVLTNLSNLLVGTHLTDVSYGFYAVRPGALRRFQMVRNGFEGETELIMRFQLAGLRIAEVPSFESARVHGVGKLRSFRDGSRIMATIFSFGLQRIMNPRSALRGPREVEEEASTKTDDSG